MTANSSPENTLPVKPDTIESLLARMYQVANRDHLNVHEFIEWSKNCPKYKNKSNQKTPEPPQRNDENLTVAVPQKSWFEGMFELFGGCWPAFPQIDQDQEEKEELK